MAATASYSQRPVLRAWIAYSVCERPHDYSCHGADFDWIEGFRCTPHSKSSRFRGDFPVRQQTRRFECTVFLQKRRFTVPFFSIFTSGMSRLNPNSQSKRNQLYKHCSVLFAIVFAQCTGRRKLPLCMWPLHPTFEEIGFPWSL